MEHLNPFSHSFEVFGKMSTPSLEDIHSDPFERLTLAAAQAHVGQRGQHILLRAPTAGYGKTHLLSRLRNRLTNWCVFPANPVRGTELSAGSAIEDIVGSLLSAIPGGGGLTDLDLLARKLFSVGLEPLVLAGDVPCDDVASAVDALRNHPIETFDFHEPDAPTAQWTMENHEVLEPRMSLELAEKSMSSHRETSFWLHAFFEYAMSPPGAPLRNASLTDTLGRALRDASETLQMERLTALINMISVLHPCGIIIDETEGLLGNRFAALTVASFTHTLRRLCPGVFIVISVNDDVWKSSFAKGLSGGLLERLSEVEIELQSITPDQAADLVEHLDEVHTDAVKEAVEKLLSPLTPRAVMREAARVWQEKQEEDLEESVLEELLKTRRVVLPVPEKVAEPEPAEEKLDGEVSYPAFSFAQAAREAEAALADKAGPVPLGEGVDAVKRSSIPLETTAVPVRSAANRRAKQIVPVAEAPLPPQGPPELSDDDEASAASQSESLAPLSPKTGLAGEKPEMKAIHYPLHHTDKISAARPYMTEDSDVPKNKVQVKAETRPTTHKSYPPVAAPVVPMAVVTGPPVPPPAAAPEPTAPAMAQATPEPLEEPAAPSGPPVFRATPRPEFAMMEGMGAPMATPAASVDEEPFAEPEKPAPTQGLWSATPSPEVRPDMPAPDMLPKATPQKASEKGDLTGVTAAWPAFPGASDRPKRKVTPTGPPKPPSDDSGVDESQVEELLQDFRERKGDD